MDKLIYDRTENDVKNKTNKGYHNISDLNRIEEWCTYLAILLSSYNYKVDIVTKVDWKMTDFRYDFEMERIRKNIEIIKGAYIVMKNTPQLPTSLNPITWQKANEIEKILMDIDLLIKNMKASFLYYGTFNSGESEGMI